MLTWFYLCVLHEIEYVCSETFKHPDGKCKEKPFLVQIVGKHIVIFLVEYLLFAQSLVCVCVSLCPYCFYLALLELLARSRCTVSKLKAITTNNVGLMVVAVVLSCQRLTLHGIFT